MSSGYSPGPANGTLHDKSGESWTFVLERELRHPPARVWAALTDPAQLREWAPFDADGSLGVAGASVTLTTVGAPLPHAVVVRIERADFPDLLEYDWGGSLIRWELEDYDGGTRLRLWASIDRRYIAMGAAGWHLCLDVLEHLVDGRPLGRMVGPPMLQHEGWQRLRAEYAELFK